MRDWKYIPAAVVVLLLFLSPTWAQVKIGDETNLSLNGTLGVGYSGNYGLNQGSEHSLGLNGNAQLTGYYYNPNFLNFYVTPIYNRSQENSGSGSITDATAISAGAGIFSGSHFPGSISFGKSFNSTGNFGLPGIQGFTTTGDSTSFGIGWSELLPGLPPLTAQYSQTSSSNSIFGSDQDYHSSSKNLSLTSNYMLDKWMLTARFTNVYTTNQLPSFLSDGEYNVGDDNSRTFSFNASHKLPLQGSFAFNYSYGSFSGDGNGNGISGSNSTYSGTASFVPWSRLTTTFGVQYDTDLTGLVEQQLINVGSIAPQTNLGYDSDSLSLYNFDTLQIWRNLTGSFNFNRIQQDVYGTSIAVNHFSGIVNYHFNKPLLGSFTVYGGVNDQSTDEGHQGTGLTGGVGFNRKVKGFELAAGFNYSQNVETVLANEVTSTYTYQASAQRHVSRRFTWNSTFAGFHSGLGELAGSSSHSESATTTLIYRGYGAGVSYGQSYGTALLTAGGLISTPVPITPVLSGNQYLLVNGKSYGINLSATPVDRLTISATLNKAQNSTLTPSVYSSNGTKLVTVYTQYQMRKISFGGGYSRVIQGVSATTLVPTDFSSFYFGIQRWFHPF